MTDKDDVFRGTGVKIRLKEYDDFLKIKETLTRIGVASEKNTALYQSCNILHKRDFDGESLYAILHFKELFKLDGKPSSLDAKDVARRNSIVKLLVDWGLLETTDKDFSDSISDQEQKEIMSTIKVLKHSEKSEWDLIAKYKIGRK